MKIIIIGLGLIGGSIAKTLAKEDGITIFAYDSNQSSIQSALESKSIQGSINTLDELRHADYENSLLIISTPPRVSLSILKSLSFLFNSSVTITDTASTKSGLNEILEEFNFPKNIIFSHPVAGSHLSDQENSISNLFENKPVILSSHSMVTELHLDRVKNLWGKLGSNISELDLDTHDHIFAYSSHLPHVAAYSLLMTLKNIDQENLSKFSGGGLGEFLRLASSSPQMWADILSLNDANILLAIDSLINNLDKLKDRIANNPKDLQRTLEELKNFKEMNY